MRSLILLFPWLMLAQHPVDRIVGLYFQSNSVTPPPAVSDPLFARRAYLDVWGLLPAPGQLQEFIQDRHPDKHQILVDRLLANNELYMHHWITFWNDHLRNDEGVVYHGDRKSITPWLRPALVENLPYDRFLQALLNPTEKTDPDGFLTGVNWRGDINASQTPVMQAAQNSAQVFLGVNLKCNSCHDSFISRWKLKDAYGLASFFSDRPLEIHRCDAPSGVLSEARFLYPELGAVAADASLTEKRAAAARLFTMRENGRTPRTLVNRFWKVLFGRGLVEPPDDMDAKPWSKEVLDWLADDFVAHNYDMKHLLRRILTSTTYRLESVKDAPETPYVFRGPHARRLSAEQFLDAVSSVTGEWRVLEPRNPVKATYARDWQLKSSSLGRALGRPIRDQVTTERITNATTLQALEMVNGATLASLLDRGSKRMLGQLPPAPEPLFDSGMINKQQPAFDVDVSGVKKVWLVLRDVDSYDPARVSAWWQIGGSRMSAALPSTREFSIAKGSLRLKGLVGVDLASLASDISPRIRFLIYKEPPNPDQLLAVSGEPPVARPPRPVSFDRVWVHALTRSPSTQESKLLKARPSAEVLEDTLWALFLLPEFQYIR